MKRLVPFVDHEIGYRLLQKLVTRVDDGTIEIPAVVTTRENGKFWWPGVDEVCRKAKIPLFIYGPNFSFGDFISTVDWFLLLSWKHIIQKNLVNLPRYGVLNLHYSLLPLYRGVYPVNWAIINGDEKTGFTYHFVNEKVDDGEIFMQIDLPVRLSDTARTLQTRIDNVVCHHFDEFLVRLLSYDSRNCRLSIDSPMDCQGEYYSRKRFEEVCRIDPNRTYRGRELYNLLRGLTFLDNSKNAYIADEVSGEKIYISLRLKGES